MIKVMKTEVLIDFVVYRLIELIKSLSYVYKIGKVSFMQLNKLK